MERTKTGEVKKRERKKETKNKERRKKVMRELWLSNKRSVAGSPYRQQHCGRVESDLAAVYRRPLGAHSWVDRESGEVLTIHPWFELHMKTCVGCWMVADWQCLFVHP